MKDALNWRSGKDRHLVVDVLVDVGQEAQKVPVVAVVDGALYLSILLLLLAQETILDLSVLLLLLAQETVLDLRVLVCLLAQDIVLDLGVLVQLTLHKGANEAQLQHRQRIRRTRQTAMSPKRQQAGTSGHLRQHTM